MCNCPGCGILAWLFKSCLIAPGRGGIFRHLSSCWVAFGWPCSPRHGSGRVCLGTGDFLQPQGAVPPGFYPLRGGWVHCLAPEVRLWRGMPMGPKVFLAMPDACGLWPCDRTQLKNGLVPDLYAGRAYDRYRGVLSLGNAQETSLDVGLLKKIVAGEKEFIGKSYENCHFQRRNSAIHLLLRKLRLSNSTWNWFRVFSYERLFYFCYWQGILSPHTHFFHLYTMWM